MNQRYLYHRSLFQVAVCILLPQYIVDTVVSETTSHHFCDHMYGRILTASDDFGHIYLNLLKLKLQNTKSKNLLQWKILFFLGKMKNPIFNQQYFNCIFQPPINRYSVQYLWNELKLCYGYMFTRILNLFHGRLCVVATSIAAIGTAIYYKKLKLINH
jgi:hypothetical protein